MRWYSPRRRLLLIFCTLLLCLTGIIPERISFASNSLTFFSPSSVLAQTEDSLSAPKVPPQAPKIASVTAFLDGEPLFPFQARLGPSSPKERVKIFQEKLLRVAQDGSISLDDIRTSFYPEFNNAVALEAKDILLMTLTPEDAKAANRPLKDLAEDYLQKIRTAILKYRESRTQASLIQGVIQAITATILLSILLFIVNRFLPFFVNKVFTLFKPYFKKVDNQLFLFLPRHQLAQIVTSLLNAIRVFTVLFLFYIYIPFVLSCFPWTRGIGISLIGYFWSAIDYLWSGFVDYLPNLFILLLTIVAAYYCLRFSNFFFAAIRQGKLTIPGFYSEWAKPTANLINFFIISLSAVLIFPYLPASTSKSFQGVSIFIGALFTFGSTSIIGNIVSGIVLIYTRAFQLEDIIQVNGQRGKVVEKGMLSTRILTADNEVVTIPNASLLVSDITNFSAIMRDRQQPLLLKTTVTLGYDLPWRKVHETLIKAAQATDGILHDPEPFVLQTSLDDFYVSYTLKAFTLEPDKMPLIYSVLHQNIQDQCNEVGIEIMSPHYSTLRDGNASTIPAHYLPEDYQAPGFKLDLPGKG